jgi:hypothetical protein
MTHSSLPTSRALWAKAEPDKDKQAAATTLAEISMSFFMV